MGAEEYGVESEIIRATELRVKPCKGCEACSMALMRGGESRCVIKDDDVEWILEKTLVEDSALIVSVPIYLLSTSGYLKIITDRMLATMYRRPEIIKKTRIGGIIAVGAGGPERTPLGLIMANIFVQHTRKVVDQVQINNLGRPRGALGKPEALSRARELGRNVARSMSLPIEEVKYLGKDTAVACPVCHCNILQVPDKLPEVFCPVCWVRGAISMEGDKMTVKWNPADTEHARLTEYSLGKHMEFLTNMSKGFPKPDPRQDQEKDLLDKYIAYEKTIKP